MENEIVYVWYDYETDEDLEYTHLENAIKDIRQHQKIIQEDYKQEYKENEDFNIFKKIIKIEKIIVDNN